MTEKQKGILCIIGSAFFFSIMSVFVRMAGDLPTMQKALFRNIVSVIVLVPMIVREHDNFRLEKNWIPTLLLRATFGTLGLICNFYAVDHLNISDANMLNKLSPFFAILMSGILLHERARLIEWAAVFVAFIGALFVIKPGFNMDIFPALVGFFGGFVAGNAQTMLRKLGNMKVPGPVIILFFSSFSTLVCIPFFILQFQPMSAFQLICLLMAGATATGGQFFITAAYRHAPAKEISAFDYVQIIFAAIWGFFIFDQVPDVFSFLGYFIIIGAAVVRTVSGNKPAAARS